MNLAVDFVDVEKFHQETSDVKRFRCSSVDGIQFGRSAEAGECKCSFDVFQKVFQLLLVGCCWLLKCSCSSFVA